MSDGQAAGAAVKSFLDEARSCYTRRRGGLSSLVAGVLTSPAPVDCVAHLSLSAGVGMGHPGLYDSLANGTVDREALERVWFDCADRAGLPEIYTVDATAYPRPESPTLAGRHMVHCPARMTANGSPTVPGLEFQVIVRQTPDRDSWNAPVAVFPTDPDARPFAALATEIGRVAARHVGAHPGSRPWFVLDSGYPAARLTFELRSGNVPAEVLLRFRSNGVLYGEVPSGDRTGPKGGHPRIHGTRLDLRDPASWPDPTCQVTICDHAKFGTVDVKAFVGFHQKLRKQSSGMSDMPGDPNDSRRVLLPHVVGTVIAVAWEKDGRSGNMALWWSGPVDGRDTLVALFDTYTHRYDIEHLFRYTKSQLGLVGPKLGTRQAHWRWVQVVLTAYVALLVARGLVSDIRLPWEATPPGRQLTPGRVRRWVVQHPAVVAVPTTVAKPRTQARGRTSGARNRVRERYETIMRTPVAA